jgi:hypothetical protein
MQETSKKKKIPTRSVVIIAHDSVKQKSGLPAYEILPRRKKVWIAVWKAVDKVWMRCETVWTGT